MAIFSDYKAPSTDEVELVKEKYVVNTAGADYAVNDVVEKTYQVNTATGAVVATFTPTWSNLSAGGVALAAAPADAELDQATTDIILGSETVAVAGAAAVGSALTPPALANHALIQFFSSDAAWDLDGVALDRTTPGADYWSNMGAVVELDSAAEIAGFLAYSLDAALPLDIHVTYHLTEAGGPLN